MEDVEEDSILDIDVTDFNNPLAVVEYVDDIYAYYRKNEVGVHQLMKPYNCFIYQN